MNLMLIKKMQLTTTDTICGKSFSTPPFAPLSDLLSHALKDATPKENP